MEIRPFKAGDADRLDLQDIDRWAFSQLADLHEWEGYAFTVLDDAGQPLGVSGFSLEGGIGTGWLIGSRQLRENSVYLHRTMKRILRELLRTPAVTCIYADVEQKSVAAVRWLERLGFRRGPENDTIARYVLDSEEGQLCQS